MSQRYSTICPNERSQSKSSQHCCRDVDEVLRLRLSSYNNVFDPIPGRSDRIGQVLERPLSSRAACDGPVNTYKAPVAPALTTWYRLLTKPICGGGSMRR